MIIVSQNKNSIYNFENVKSIDIIGNEIFITDDILADIGTLIAEYKTQERAKEVLQDIANVTRSSGWDCINRKDVYIEIFEMPEE